MKTEITIDVEQVLDELGARNVREVGNEVNFSCPDPSHTHGDNSPSAYMRQSYPYPHICFGCGRKGTVVDFVAEWLGVENPAAWRWLGTRFGFESTYDPKVTITDTLNRLFGPKYAPEASLRDNPEIRPPKMYPATEVDAARNYLNGRGLNDYAIQAWKLQFDPFSGRVVIPVHDRVGTLVGLKARSIANEEPKYLVLGDRKSTHEHYGFKPYNTSVILFGLHRIPKTERSLVIYEGELDTIAAWQAGITNAVGLPTASMSEYQAAVIREGFEEVTLFLDSDVAGIKGFNTACKLLAGAVELKAVDHHEDDPMDMEPELIRELVKNAQSPLLTQIKQITGGK